MTTATATPFSIASLSLVNKDNLRAMVTAKVMDFIFLTGIRVIEGKNGLFVAMPARKTVQGEYQDIFFPASREMRTELQRVILESYEKQVSNPSPRPAESAAEPALAGAF